MATHGQKLMAAGATAALVEPALALAHQGALGVIVGLGLSAAAYVVVEDIERHTGKALLPARSPSTELKRKDGLSLAYRLLVGKSRRQQEEDSEQIAQPGGETSEEALFDPPSHEIGLTPPRSSSSLFLFSEVLGSFSPSAQRIFLARRADGVDLFCAASQLCHVALAGNTGGGKTSLQRMLMLQLCQARMKMLLLNPHYTPYDIENDEDWTPFEPYLAYSPLECVNYEVIAHFLKMAATDLIPKRLHLRRNCQPYGRPYFLVIDELPSIVRQVKEAPDYMRVILEEGRKVGVFLICAAHDFLVKTISPNSGGGSIRECYRTAYYVGGDSTTANVLLDMPAKQLPEAELGKGVVMLRGADPACKKATKVFVPYVDNAALYRSLGPSTYRRSITSRLPSPGVDFTFPAQGTSRPMPRTPTLQDEGQASYDRQQLLQTIERLADTVDEETLLRLIEQFPRVRDEENEEDEISGYQVDSPLCPIAKPEKKVVALNEAIAAWNEGATSVSKLEDSLGISHHQAYKFYQQMKQMSEQGAL